tara:strand:+ start:1223 stop:1414 length:192 start_codon:yes stop_codon:yes gene_type:complete
MKNNFSFNEKQMNGIVEETYKKIINDCNKLRKETNCPNEQILALLSLIASNYTPISKQENEVD